MYAIRLHHFTYWCNDVIFLLPIYVTMFHLFYQLCNNVSLFYYFMHQCLNFLPIYVIILHFLPTYATMFHFFYLFLQQCFTFFFTNLSYNVLPFYQFSPFYHFKVQCFTFFFCQFKLQCFTFLPIYATEHELHNDASTS